MQSTYTPGELTFPSSKHTLQQKWNHLKKRKSFDMARLDAHRVAESISRWVSVCISGYKNNCLFDLVVCYHLKAWMHFQATFRVIWLPLKYICAPSAVWKCSLKVPQLTSALWAATIGVLLFCALQGCKDTDSIIFTFRALWNTGVLPCYPHHILCNESKRELFHNMHFHEAWLQLTRSAGAIH